MSNRKYEPGETCYYGGTCNRPIETRGLCAAHYKRAWLEARKETAPRCEFEQCDKPRYAKGLCKGHHQQQWTGKPLTPLQDRVPRGTWTGVTECLVDGCKRPLRAKGLCPTHLWQVQKSKDKRIKQPRTFAPGEWGDWYTDSSGYRARQRYWPRTPEEKRGRSEKQHQHRFVMEQQLGRALLSTETVHHLNGDRADNRVENLQLWTGSHPAGQCVIDKVKWAYELIALYDPDGRLAPGAPGF